MTKDRLASPGALRRGFTEAQLLIGVYRRRLGGRSSDQASWSAEAQKRLEQLAWMVGRIAALQERLDRIWHSTWDSTPTRLKPGTQHARRGGKQRRLGAEIELLSESFYYFAWRLRQVLVNLPEFKKFNPKGIRDVRYDLLDHPEKVSKALNPNFMYGHNLTTGPRLKPFGPRERPVHDNGLYINAGEMLEELLPRLRLVVVADAGRITARQRPNKRLQPTVRR